MVNSVKITFEFTVNYRRYTNTYFVTDTEYCAGHQNVEFEVRKRLAEAFLSFWKMTGQEAPTHPPEHEGTAKPAAPPWLSGLEAKRKERDALRIRDCQEWRQAAQWLTVAEAVEAATGATEDHGMPAVDADKRTAQLIGRLIAIMHREGSLSDAEILEILGSEGRFLID